MEHLPSENVTYFLLIFTIVIGVRHANIGNQLLTGQSVINAVIQWNGSQMNELWNLGLINMP